MTDRVVHEGIRIDFQDTPQLWMATRESYDGAVDSHDPQGLGKTPVEALAHLLEQEETPRHD